VKASALSPFTTVREAYTSTFFWKPDRFPDLRIQYSRDHLYDRDRVRTDTITDLYQATSNYRPTEALSLYYQGTFRNTELRLSDATTEETINNGRVNYSNNWLRRRITFGLDYSITNQQIKTATSGSGEVGVRVFPFAGVSASSDTPETIPLASNPALIDGDLAAVTGINLGLPSPGADSRLKNMGLDFILATEINTLYVWVDRDVAQVADAFSWRVYTSDDNRNWIFRQTVSPGLYSPTFNRFEIRFAALPMRCVHACPVSFVVEGAVPSSWGSPVVVDPTIPTTSIAVPGLAVLSLRFTNSTR